MRYLALDLGTRRTGVAFADTEGDILFSLETIKHTSEDELLAALLPIIKEKNIDELILGLPLLPSGKEGSQVEIVQDFGEILADNGISCSYIDERYTTPKQTSGDGDSAAACTILAVKLDQN